MFNNVESDLYQEHTVKNLIQLIKQLGRNKSEKIWVQTKYRSITCYYTKVIKAYQMQIKSMIASVLPDLKPFKFTSGRILVDFLNLIKLVLNELMARLC